MFTVYNTKLLQFQKDERKQMKAVLLAAGGALFTFEGFTMAIQPVFEGSTMALVSTSTASPAEGKIRRKVGEFHALEKMRIGEFIQVPLATRDFEDFARTLAHHFGFEEDYTLD